MPKLLAFLTDLRSEGVDATSPEGLAHLATGTLVAASRRLWRLGALEPQGYGVPPKVTALGTWLLKVSKNHSVSPAAARALFFGAFYHCLLPMAATVALLQPDMEPKKSLRTAWRSRLRSSSLSSTAWSGHFILIASYLKWRESKEMREGSLFSAVAVREQTEAPEETGVSETQTSCSECHTAEDAENVATSAEGIHAQSASKTNGDAFWEALDAKVMTFCQFAQSQFNLNDLDLDGRPWTVALLDDQHSLVLAALCSAFPPRRRPGEWVVQGDFRSFLEVELRVSNACACLFTSSPPRRVGDHEVELVGFYGRIKPGMEASFKESCAIRAQIASNIALALDQGNASIGLAKEQVQRILNFLSSPRGDFLVCENDSHELGADGAAEGSAEEVGLGVLTLLGRADAGSACGGRDRMCVPAKRASYKDALRGRIVPHAQRKRASSEMGPPKPRPVVKRNDHDHSESMDVKKRDADGGEETEKTNPEPIPSKCVEDWATGLVHAALLRVLKRRAAAAEEFDVASRLKARERGADTALCAGRARAVQLLHAPKLAAIEKLNDRKRKAVEFEDYELARQLKQKAVAVEAEIKSVDEAALEDLALEQASRLASMILGGLGGGGMFSGLTEKIEPVENDRYARGIKEENLQLHEDGARSEPNEYHLQAAV
ncbi:Uncharacterized protein SCF082_LOCUS8076 [Durusdinium trenchii]|uniref:Helicase-associated domain-containing protein n=1 Tax=Durusdinium trenchii TaxID=1381693 RepID=A0ABP0INP9_9DINO